jgi:hypothetical protein
LRFVVNKEALKHLPGFGRVFRKHRGCDFGENVNGIVGLPLGEKSFRVRGQLNAIQAVPLEQRVRLPEIEDRGAPVCEPLSDDALSLLTHAPNLVVDAQIGQ